MKAIAIDPGGKTQDANFNVFILDLILKHYDRLIVSKKDCHYQN